MTCSYIARWGTHLNLLYSYFVFLPSSRWNRLYFWVNLQHNRWHVQCNTHRTPCNTSRGASSDKLDAGSRTPIHQLWLTHLCVRNFNGFPGATYSYTLTACCSRSTDCALSLLLLQCSWYHWRHWVVMYATKRCVATHALRKRAIYAAAWYLKCR